MTEDSPGLNPYEARQEERRARYQELAERKRREAQAAEAGARRIMDGIPLGQPILVGHHSERRHRRDIERMRSGLEKAHASEQAARHYEEKAKSYGTHGISSDDPDAVSKLQERLAELEAEQARDKAINKAMRSKDPIGALRALGLKDSTIQALRTPDELHRTGIPAYVLSNRNGNMARIRKRIAELEAKTTQASSERVEKGVRIVENVEENRLQLFFPGKPSEQIRSRLKSNGFRYSPTTGAWQRQRSNTATWAASVVLHLYEPTTHAPETGRDD